MTGTTHVYMIVDRSGSMAPLRHDVIGGYNQYLNKLATDKTAKYKVNTVLFNTTLVRTGPASPKNVTRLDENLYSPGGMTALYDAIGTTVDAAPRLGAKSRSNSKGILVIMTDGFENSSREYDAAAIRSRLTELEATGKWSVIYIGQGIDTWDQASRMGIHRGSYVQTSHDPAAVMKTYSGLATGTIAMAAGASVKEFVKEVREAVGDDTHQHPEDVA